MRLAPFLIIAAPLLFLASAQSADIPQSSSLRARNCRRFRR
jgi:hypothetical protein